MLIAPHDLFPMFAPLPEGPLDIVGDVHGELDALRALLAHLGYDTLGRHPDGRRLVFAGDLCDRGPDSPGVLALVQPMVEAGRALAVLGNHELNLLRGDRKDGNDWFWSEGFPRDARYEPRVHVDPDRRDAVLAFLRTLPLALERADLRVIHAAWHPPSIVRLRAERPDADVLEVFRRWDAMRRAPSSPPAASTRAPPPNAPPSATSCATRPPTADAACRGARRRDRPDQQSRAHRDLGPRACHRRAPVHRRHLALRERVRWWDEYHEDTSVVVGHYWRPFVMRERRPDGQADANLFDQLHAHEWHGARSNVFCVDFSVGGRYRERPLAPGTVPSTRLGAIRWPERTLTLDTGETLATSPERVPEPSQGTAH